MMNRRVISRFLVLVTFTACSVAGASQSNTSVVHLAPKRISATVMDLGKATPISMVIGMITVVIIPDRVTEVDPGDPDSLAYFHIERTPTQVKLILKNNKAKPTNLILQSGKKRYVFDIVPSARFHQDIVEITGDYGGPEYSESGMEMIDSSDTDIRKGTLR